VALATGLPSVFGSIALDSENVYWVADGRDGVGTLLSLPLAGGRPATLASLGPRHTNIVVAGGNVYWGAASSGILRVPVRGGTASIVLSTHGRPTSLAADATNLYFLQDFDDKRKAGKASSALDRDSVVALPIAGGKPMTLATFEGSQSGADGVLAVDASSVYWTDRVSGSLMRVAREGGTPETLVSVNPPPYIYANAMTAIEGALFWTESEQQVEREGQPTEGGVFALFFF
jgi:hypothetical protein